MKYWLSVAAWGFALLLLVLTFVNASWIASPPPGSLRLVAHRGVSQLFDHRGVGNDSCTATRIEQPVHDYLENTPRSLQAASQLGADMVEVDVVPTADGRIAIFHDWTLDCRTEGKGETRSRSLADLQALDPGYGYTADGGKTFPLRGRRKDRIPSLEEALAVLPATSVLFNFKSKDPREADLLAAALKAANRDVAVRRDAFTGDPALVERIKTHFPDAWAFSKEGIKACTKAYVAYGWTGIVPAACRDGTLAVALDKQWLYWGWPNRLMQRMAGVNGRVIVMGPMDGNYGSGLTLPEQLGDIPDSFRGHVFVDDIWTVGPALRPGRDFRTDPQIEAANKGLERRRAN
jgi:glycerophosphoryl diester phosphodiesterase